MDTPPAPHYLANSDFKLNERSLSYHSSSEGSDNALVSRVLYTQNDNRTDEAKLEKLLAPL